MNRNYDWLHCSNKELLKELEEKENLFEKIACKILKCPHCKEGTFFLETSDEEYSNESWWMCNNLNCDAYPSKQREKMLWEILVTGKDQYWDYGLYVLQEQFTHNYKTWTDEGYEDIREFDPIIFNQEKEMRKSIFDISKNLDWEDLVEETIKNHIKTIDVALNNAKKYKRLKKILEE